MPNAITDLLTSAKILADANRVDMLSYLVAMALAAARETDTVRRKSHTAA